MAGGIAEGMTAGAAAGNAIANRLEAIRRRQMTDALDRANLRQSQVLYGQAATGGQPETKGVVERAQDVTENTPENRWNMSLLQRPTQAPVTLASLKNNVKELEPVINPVLDELTSANIKTRGDLRTRLFQAVQTPQFTEARMNILERASKLMDQGKRTEATKLMQFYNSTGPDGITDLIDTVMGKPRELIEQDRLARAQIEAKSQGGDAWSEPYQDGQGNTIQKNLNTGQVRKITGAPSGTRIKVGPGGTEIIMGSQNITSRSMGDVEKNIMEADAGLARLDDIVSRFDEKYLTVGGKMRGTLLNMKDMLTGSLTAEQTQFIQEQSELFQTSAEDFNLYVKSITGAQVSAQEAERMKFARANYGKTWFTGDGPTKFLTKAQNSRRMLLQAKQRYEMYRARGLDDNEISGLISSGKAMPLDRFKVDDGGANSKAVGKLVQEPSTMNPSQMTDEQLMEEAKRLGIR